ncbi:hypothetical protein EDD86DRAFT_277657 [Gorgonomyces haynaldii]|nr:hypothetical protein EDD86DRAFT_277657 [Gorgonomyces haynaldii]
MDWNQELARTSNDIARKETELMRAKVQLAVEDDLREQRMLRATVQLCQEQIDRLENYRRQVLESASRYSGSQLSPAYRRQSTNSQLEPVTLTSPLRFSTPVSDNPQSQSRDEIDALDASVVSVQNTAQSEAFTEPKESPNLTQIPDAVAVSEPVAQIVSEPIVEDVVVRDPPAVEQIPPTVDEPMILTALSPDIPIVDVPMQQEPVIEETATLQTAHSMSEMFSKTLQQTSPETSNPLPIQKVVRQASPTPPSSVKPVQQVETVEIVQLPTTSTNLHINKERKKMTIGERRPRVQKFWKALKAIPDQIVNNCILSLPTDTFFLGAIEEGWAVYVRPCFIPLATQLFELSNSFPTVRVMGSPGVGKSYFAYFLLLWISRTGATVVHETHNRRYFFSKDTADVGNLHSFEDILQTGDYYIVDGPKPTKCKAKTIELCNFRTGSAKKRVILPLWSRDELKRCRDSLFLNVSLQKMDELFLKWSGNPKYVLEQAYNDNEQHRLLEAIKAVPLTTLVDGVEQGRFLNDVSAFMTHFVEKDSKFYFLNDYVADLYFAHVYQTQKQQLVGFLSRPDAFSAYTFVFMALLDRLAHLKLSKGGRFKIKQLIAPLDAQPSKKINLEQQHLKLEPLNTVLIHQYIDPSVHSYFKVKHKLDETTISIVLPNYIFFVHQTDFCSIPQDTVQMCLDLLGNPALVRIYFHQVSVLQVTSR